VSISDLPKEKNIVDFEDEELFKWIKDYIGDWASSGVGPQEHYDAVKTEIQRRNSKRVLNLTNEIHSLTKRLLTLTRALVGLTIILAILAVMQLLILKG